MTSLNQRLAFVSLATCVLVGTFGAISALGGERLTESSKTVEVSSNEHGSATATCDRGTSAVSGGFDTDWAAGGPAPFPDQSSRTGRRGWTTEGINWGFAPSGNLTAYAYCREGEIASRTVSREIDPGGAGTVTARCDRGTRAVSGGFNADRFTGAPDDPRFHIGVSRKVGRRAWKVGGANIASVPGDLIAKVNCREGGRLKTRSTSGEKPGLFNLDATCKPGERVVSGGFADPTFAGNSATRLYVFKRLGIQTWHLYGYGDEVTLYAYCERGLGERASLTAAAASQRRRAALPASGSLLGLQR